MSIAAQSLRMWGDRLDQRLIQLMSRYGVSLLRISLAIVFIWFGLLKIIGKSPQ